MSWRAPRFRRWRWAIALSALLGWGAYTAMQLSRAASEARAAEGMAQRARAAVSVDASNGDAIGRLQSAAARFRQAHRRVRHPAVAPLRVVPVMGRQVRSFDALSGQAAHVASAMSRALERADRAIGQGRGGRTMTGPERVALLRELVRVAADAERELGPPRLGPVDGLVPPLARARDRLARELEGLRQGLHRGRTGAKTAAEVLEGPRRYLVLAANNAEMRSGSGMFLSAGTMETRSGALSVSPFTSTADLDVAAEAVPPLEGDVADRWGWLGPNHEWANLAVSPRFDAMAPLAARMWEALGRGPVDGVLAVDASALSGILSAVGPVDVDEERFSADNVVEWLMHGQYLDASTTERRERLGRVAGAVLTAVEEKSWSARKLGLALAAAGRGRHLLAWSSRPGEQDGWATAGVHGGLGPDSLLVGVLNRGGNKLDRFLTVTADLDVRRSPNRPREASVRVTLHNQTPAGEPPYVAGPHPESGVGEGGYVGVVAVNLPGSARNGRIEGEPRLAVAGPDGPTRVVGSFVQVARGEQRQVVIRFELPPEVESVAVEPSARLPSIRWSAAGRRWDDSSARRVPLSDRTGG